MKTIFQAAHENDVDCLREKLADARAVDGDTGWTPLRFAAAQSSFEAAALLLEAGASVDAVSPCGETPLHCVAGIEVTRLGVADLGVRDGEGFTAAERAWSNGSIALFKVLAERSDVARTLRSAWAGKLWARCTYRGEANEIQVIELGWKAGRERCLAWQYDNGWCCFAVTELSNVVLDEATPDLERPGKPSVCVEVLEDVD